jgi:ArsR family transcriptional regulator, arsenate/arsenite/antimonite-responsive transcriptional repressor
MKPARVVSRRGTVRGSDLPNHFDREMATLARALGHPARVAILRLLLDAGECICGDIVVELPLAQATVSQHLKVLKEAGLVRGEIDGPRVCYCADPDGVKRLKNLVATLKSGA